MSDKPVYEPIIDLTEDDDVLLDAIWDRVAQEEKIDNPNEEPPSEG